MDEKSQISKIDNDDLRDFEQGFRRYFDENFPSVIRGGGGSLLSRRLLGGVKRIYKSKRGRPRRLAPRIKNRLTIATARRLTERMGLLMTVPESHPVDPHIPSQLATSLIYE